MGVGLVVGVLLLFWVVVVDCYGFFGGIWVFVIGDSLIVGGFGLYLVCVLGEEYGYDVIWCGKSSMGLV